MPASLEYPVPESFARKSYLDDQQYRDLYRRSLEDNDGFWKEQATTFVQWMKPFTQVKDVSYDAKDLHIKWFYDGTLNVCANCLDKHLPQRASQTAFLWESDDGKASRTITYQDLHDEVCRLANAMKGLGVKKGDRVTIYMPMVPAAAATMLACARIGAVHSVVFAGFSAEALAGRIQDCEAKLVVTRRRGTARRQNDSAQSLDGQSPCTMSHRRECHRLQKNPRKDRVARGQRPRLPRSPRQR